MLLPTAMTACAALIVVAVVTAVRESRRLLWRRALVLPVLVYATGGWAGWWPWDAARPAAGWAITWIGG